MKPGLCPDMPLMVGDWLSSTRIAVMCPAQEGAFFRLLLHAWSDPRCTLPDDDEVLAELSRLRADWPTLGAKVRACFVSDPQRPGRIFNEKQRSVRDAQASRVQAAKAHASTAAKARWSRTPQPMPEHRASIAQAVPEQCGGNASYSAPGSHDKAYSTKKSKTTKPRKLSTSQSELAGRFEAALGEQWVNDAGKWVNRIKTELGKCERVVAEIEGAAREGGINATPAQYAEQLWKEFV